VTWVRFDDGFMDHPKLLNLRTSPTALAVHMWAMCYVSRHLTEGFVPEGILGGCPWVSKRSVLQRALELLESSRLWHRVEGGWQIHDFLDYNPDAASVREKRQQNAERQSRWRARQKERRNAVSNGVTEEGRNAPPDPTPKSGGGRRHPLKGAPPPPPKAKPVFKMNGRMCFRCEREGLPLAYASGQHWCEDCLRYA
jgi:hypothetical protein